MRRAIFVNLMVLVMTLGVTTSAHAADGFARQWTHASETSAVIYWQTSQQARSSVEYGETVKYGRKTPLSGVSSISKKPYWTQFHRLTGLLPGKTYHYRMVSIGMDGKKFLSEDRTFTTNKYADAIRIPDDFTNAPYTLDKPGATYVLTKDIKTQGAAIQIVASDITLDLDGHTILYDQKDGVPSGAYVKGVPPTRGVGHGIIMDLANANKSMSDVKIFNGIVKQGDGNGEGNNAGLGYNPFLTTGPSNLELAGITAIYKGSSMSGLVIRKPGEGCNIHHNVIEDLGTEIKNRHLGLDAIYTQTDRPNTKPDSLRVHHNLIKRCRHRAIRGGGGSNIHHNEMYIDSFATNSYGIMFYSTKIRNVKAANNRIFGVGYNPVAIGVGWVTNAKIDANYIELVASKPTGRWAEFGDLSLTSGIRVHGGSDIEVSRNTLNIYNARGGGSKLRGFWSYWKNSGPTNLVFRENVVKVIVTPDSTDKAYCVVAGDASGSSPEIPPVIYRNNTFISNICNVTLGDDYCPRSFNKRFVGNRFVRVGDDPRYCTIKCGETGYPAVGSVFVDSVFEGGAGYDKVKYKGGGKREFSVSWTLALQAAPGAKVTIKDKTGQEVFSGTLPRTGKVEVSLIEFVRKREGKTTLTPHTITVTGGGVATEKIVTMDRKRAYKVTGTTWKAEPLPPLPAKDARIVEGPTAQRKNGKVFIRFSLDKPSDVVIRVLDADGRIVRNLASGVLGENVPLPFKKGALAQEIVWDGKDDDGKALRPGKYAIKVDAGVTGKFDRILASSLDALGGTVSDMDTDAEGRLYVKARTRGESWWIGAGDFLIFDREGKFVRSIVPHNPNILPPQGVGRDAYERMQGVAGLGAPPWLAVSSDGTVFLPGGGVRVIDRYGFFRAWGPKIGATWPPKPFAVDDEKNIYHVNDDRVSIVKYSPPVSDRKADWLRDFEFAGGEKLAEKTHVLGVPGQPGDDEKHFRNIVCLRIGPDRKIYVADRDAIKVFEKNGRYLGSIPVKGRRYMRMAIGRRTSSLYLLFPGNPGKILKLSPWPEAKEVWSLNVPQRVRALAIDESAEPPYLWVGNLNGESSFSRMTAGGKRPGEPVHFGSADRPVFRSPDLLDVDGEGRLYVLDHDRVIRVNAADGLGWKVLSRIGPVKVGGRNIHAMAIDRRNRYIYFVINRNRYRLFIQGRPAPAVNGCYRYTLDGEPAPFAALRSNCIKSVARGVTVGKDGTFYLNVNDLRRFKDMPGTRFFLEGKFYEIAPDGTAREGIHDGKPVKWDTVAESIAVARAMGIYPPRKCKVISFPDGAPYRLMSWWTPKPEDVFAHCAHVDAYGRSGELLKRDVAIPVVCSGDVVIDRRGSLYVTDIGYATSHREVWSHVFADKCSWLVKFEPGGGIRGLRGVQWEKHIGKAIRSDGQCGCSRSYLDIDELDRLYHPDRGNHCVEILDQAGNLMAVVGSYGNRECLGPESKNPRPEIPLNAVLDVAALNDTLWISDGRNRRVVKCRLVYAASSECEIDLGSSRRRRSSGASDVTGNERGKS